MSDIYPVQTGRVPPRLSSHPQSGCAHAARQYRFRRLSRPIEAGYRTDGNRESHIFSHGPELRDAALGRSPALSGVQHSAGATANSRPTADETIRGCHRCRRQRLGQRQPQRHNLGHLTQSRLIETLPSTYQRKTVLSHPVGTTTMPRTDGAKAATFRLHPGMLCEKDTLAEGRGFEPPVPSIGEGFASCGHAAASPGRPSCSSWVLRSAIHVPGRFTPPPISRSATVF